MGWGGVRVLGLRTSYNVRGAQAGLVGTSCSLSSMARNKSAKITVPGSKSTYSRKITLSPGHLKTHEPSNRTSQGFSLKLWAERPVQRVYTEATFKPSWNLFLLGQSQEMALRVQGWGREGVVAWNTCTVPPEPTWGPQQLSPHWQLV